MTVGIVGCGYVADFYALCLRANAPEITIVAVYDLDPARAQSFSHAYGGRVYSTLDGLLSHPGLDTVLNLTPPAAHFEVTARSLARSKHVFSEKPLSSTVEGGRALIEMAMSGGLALGAAPAVHRSLAARKIRQIMAGGSVGRLSHIYCDLDDGPLHRMNPREWLSPRQIPWPVEDEFRAGPVIHHMPYAATWAVAIGGAVRAIRGYTSIATKSKFGVDAGPDLCLAVLEHHSGCLTRITIGALARRFRELLIVTEECDLRLPDIWSTDGPVLQDEKIVLRSGPDWPYSSTHRLNFDRGLRDMALCLRGRGNRGPRFFTSSYGLLSLHVLEIMVSASRVGPIDAVLTPADPAVTEMLQEISLN